jgi:hypothetical protein
LLRLSCRQINAELEPIIRYPNHGDIIDQVEVLMHASIDIPHWYEVRIFWTNKGQ